MLNEQQFIIKIAHLALEEGLDPAKFSVAYVYENRTISLTLKNALEREQKRFEQTGAKLAKPGIFKLVKKNDVTPPGTTALPPNRRAYDKALAKKMYEQGSLTKEIANRVGVDRRTINIWASRFSWNKKSRNEDAVETATT